MEVAPPPLQGGGGLFVGGGGGVTEKDILLEAVAGARRPQETVGTPSEAPAHLEQVEQVLVSFELLPLLFAQRL